MIRHMSGVKYVKYVFHNDDYGLFIEESNRILRCITDGVVNSVSVMGNSTCLDECMKLIGEDVLGKKVLIATHLNVVCGKCLSDPKDVDLLVDENGVFLHKFGKLLMYSYIPFVRGKVRRQLKLEISKQINHILPYMDSEGRGIRIDSHVHYHEIPVFFDALMDVIKEEKLKVAYIRQPKEKISLYLKSGVFFSPINLVKCLVLNTLCFRNSVKYRRFLSGCEERLFLGVVQSGHMTFDKVSKLWPLAKAWSDAHNCGTEILSHPGGVKEEDDLKEITFEGDYEAMTSPLRDAEGEAWIRMKGIV